jgi:hypothetical protein
MGLSPLLIQWGQIMNVSSVYRNQKWIGYFTEGSLSEVVVKKLAVMGEVGEPRSTVSVYS